MCVLCFVFVYVRTCKIYRHSLAHAAPRRIVQRSARLLGKRQFLVATLDGTWDKEKQDKTSDRRTGTAQRPEMFPCLVADDVYKQTDFMRFPLGTYAAGRACSLHDIVRRKGGRRKDRRRKAFVGGSRRRGTGVYLCEDAHLSVGLSQAEGVGGPLSRVEKLDGALPVSRPLAVPRYHLCTNADRHQQQITIKATKVKHTPFPL